MAHKWSELRDKMSPEARARSDARYQEMKEEMERNGSLAQLEEQPLEETSGSSPDLENESSQ